MNADEIDETDDSGGTDGSTSEVTQEAIMEATYRALCEHGAVDLTVQAIADEFEKSKSLILYHYDSKEDLLSSFLVYLIERFERQVTTADIEDPTEQLDALIDALLFGPEDNESFQIAMLELRSQAPYNRAYREQFRTNDAYLHDLLETVVERGIERGAFDDVDPSRVATMLLTIIDGARVRWIVLDDEGILNTVRMVIDEQLDRMLRSDGGEAV